MTGWRIGFACAPQPVIEAMMKIHQYAILCAPIMGQEAAIEALERGEQSMLRCAVSTSCAAIILSTDLTNSASSVSNRAAHSMSFQKSAPPG